MNRVTTIVSPSNLRHWFNTWIAALQDRRECSRVSLPLIAHYWNGGVPQPCVVKTVSPIGAYLVTRDRWHPGTVVRLTFQYGTESPSLGGMENGGDGAVMLRARVVRFGDDGVGVRIVYLNKKERSNFANFLAAAPRGVT